MCLELQKLFDTTAYKVLYIYIYIYCIYIYMYIYKKYFLYIFICIYMYVYCGGKNVSNCVLPQHIYIGCIKFVHGVILGLNDIYKDD